MDETSALFPIETKDENPRPRPSAWASRARPSAPLCDEKPIEPGGNGAGSEGGVEGGLGARDAKAVRSDQPSAVASDECQELLLTCDSFPSDLGEARRDDAERPRPVSERRFAAIEDEPAGKADDGEIDGGGDLINRLVPLDSRDWLSLAVHGIGSTVEASRHDVAEEAAADRPGSRGSAHDDHALRLEERLERGDHRCVSPFVDVGAVDLSRGQRKLELDSSLVESSRNVEPGVREHAQHVAVLGQDSSDETLDPVARSDVRELLKQTHPDAAPLKVVGNRKRDFRGGWVP